MVNKRNTNTSEYYQGDESSIEDILTNTTINEEKKMDTEEIEKMIEEFSLNDSESEDSKYSSDVPTNVTFPLGAGSNETLCCVLILSKLDFGSCVPTSK